MVHFQILIVRRNFFKNSQNWNIFQLNCIDNFASTRKIKTKALYAHKTSISTVLKKYVYSLYIKLVMWLNIKFDSHFSIINFADIFDPFLLNFAPWLQPCVMETTVITCKRGNNHLLKEWNLCQEQAGLPLQCHAQCKNCQNTSHAYILMYSSIIILKFI